MSGFLTADELVTLTGAKRKSDQVTFLRRKHIRHVINLSGHPVVTWAAVNRGDEVFDLPPQPDFRAIRGAA